jgi:phosphoglucosamine mutase
VGDRYVVETMQREGILLGGEQSGHIVRRDLAATGDGLLTALHMAALRAHAGRPLSALLGELRRYPQVLVNVPVAAKVAFEKLPAVDAARRKVEETLGDDGRLVLRYSGTEPLARVMIEGPEQAAIESLAQGLAAVIGEALGRP